MLHGFGEYLIGRGSVYLGAGGWIVFWYVVGEIGSGRMEDAAEGEGWEVGGLGKGARGGIIVWLCWMQVRPGLDSASVGH